MKLHFIHKNNLTMKNTHSDSLIFRIEGLLRLITIIAFIFSFVYGNISTIQDWYSLKNTNHTKEEIIISDIYWAKKSPYTIRGFMKPDTTNLLSPIVSYGFEHNLFDKTLDRNIGDKLPIWFDSKTKKAFGRFHQKQSDFYNFYYENVIVKNLIIFNSIFFIPLVLLFLVIKFRK